MQPYLFVDTIHMNSSSSSRPALLEFAFFPKFPEKIEDLAKLAHKESWDFHKPAKPNYSILKNYLFHTFDKLQTEQKIEFSSKNQHACFNTGLVTNYLEEIYAYFERNKNTNQQEYIFKGFLKKSDIRLTQNFNSLPEIADYFSKPEDLIFNPTFDIVPQIEHIIDDNLDRFPKSWQHNDKLKLHADLTGAIDIAVKKIKTNYTLAVPQYYGGRIQLLIPLVLTHNFTNPELALVIYKASSNTYTARTCLTLEMAYNNARLIVKPYSSWLNPNNI